MNEPLESISVDLGFSGDTLAEGTWILFFLNICHFFFEFEVLYFPVNEGLVVSTCLAAAFAGSLISGWIADGVGRRRAFQLCSLPMLMGASLW